jgi:hypothetical protein
MAVRIEDAGFEIRDMIAWVYGSGLPKSLNIGKAVDKLQGNEREVVGSEKIDIGMQGGSMHSGRSVNVVERALTKGTSEWEGWGTALKPALEPITVARKPLLEKTVAENCLKWGTGGINIDGCRVEGEMGKDRSLGKPRIDTDKYGKANPTLNPQSPLGRFPANLILDGSDEVVELFPNESQRFFYCAKASKSERNKGCEELEPTRHADRNIDDAVGGDNPRNRTNTPKRNFHPTVKPIALMEYLVKLVSREGATVLDPFMGSGTTGIACRNLNRNFIGIELDKDYFEIATKRIYD